MKKTKKVTKKKKKSNSELIICCGHISSALRTKKDIAMFEVLPETFACQKCSKKEPRNEKEYLKMFNTVCRGCIGNKLK